MTRGWFVTGTDTEVGKTYVACGLVAALRGRGLRVVPMKPVAAGAVRRGDAWVNEDTEALLRAAGLDADWRDRVTPVLLREPMAPHLAAAREGRGITVDALAGDFRQLATAGDAMVVEGVGGFRVPLNAREDTRDLAVALGLPVVLVVGMRLGCLNHALLTHDAIRAAGLPIAGWVGNTVDPAMAALDENIGALQSRLGAPLLGRVPHAPAASAEVVARHLSVEPLLA